jgi:fatty acid amide hydrolase 2
LPIDPLCTLSATELAAKIRARRVTSEEAVSAHVARLRRVNPALNAVVRDRYDAALADARSADARIARGDTDLPPLFGVPCSIKESFAMAGMPNTAGLVSRRGRVVDEDAITVRRLREAGAIPLGVTNTSELCMWMESTNRVYGRTGSAFAPDRTAGGSSGGEGAVVGAAGAPFGLGSDIGGSIRMPAFFNGVFGHKSSSGLVPASGQFPIPEGATLKCLSTGPITRRATDLMPLLRLLAGPDGVDPSCTHATLHDPAGVSLRELEVLDVHERILVPVDASLIDAQARAASALSRRGARVRAARFPRLARGIEMWAARLEEGGGATFEEMMTEGGQLRLARELARWAVGRSPHTLPALGLAGLERITKRLPSMTQQRVVDAREVRAEVEAALGDRGVMLFPSHQRPAPKHGAALLPPLGWGYTAVFNALELPVTQVPLGLDRDGVPLGVQVVAAHGNDHLTIAVAIALEDSLGGWVPPDQWAS